MNQSENHLSHELHLWPVKGKKQLKLAKCPVKALKSRFDKAKPFCMSNWKGTITKDDIPPGTVVVLHGQQLTEIKLHC